MIVFLNTGLPVVLNIDIYQKGILQFSLFSFLFSIGTSFLLAPNLHRFALNYSLIYEMMP